MAGQRSLFPYSGVLGDLIGYQLNGKHFLRRRPEFVLQTAGTCRAAQRFGIASRKAALFRKTFYGDLDIRCDNGHINRLNKLLIKAAGIPSPTSSHSPKILTFIPTQLNP